MSDFTLHDLESAPEGSRETLEAIEEEFGFVFNLARVFAEAPAALNGYMQLNELFQRSSLSPAEQHVVLLTVSAENECHYCVSAHSGTAKMSGIDDGVVRALREGRSLDDPRLEALRAFTHEVVEERGWVSDETVRSFLDAGYGKRQLLEVLTGVAMKTLSNYTNHLADTPVDEAFGDFAWSPAEKEAPATVPGD